MTVSPAAPAARLDRRRYRRLLRFFAGVTIRLVLWEIVLRQILGRTFVARSRPRRLRSFAQSFRRLAVEMGGVMIKLGQFVSARVDVIPPVITDELADLQDEVPPESLEDMLGLLEQELGAPPDDIFGEFDRRVLAAASLGQVYRARLKSGDRVVVKIQRPGIEDLVATDLAALRQVARWTMAWDLIRKRADVPALLEEFGRTLWQELDYESEAQNARRFHALFEEDMRIYVPAVHPEFSTRRVLTLEDVGSIKITDYAAMEVAGISRGLVARTLLDIYLRMIFDFGFFHADPHPGNLFVYPLPPALSEISAEPTEPSAERPFYLVLVDFGMIGVITDEVKQGLKELLVAVSTRDAKRVVQAYQSLGVLLPSADTQRIEQAGQEALDTVWGLSVPELARMPRSDMHDFALKYRDLLFDMPFQIPQNFIYLARAVGILSGICTGLDPEFNPWAQIAEYAQRLIQREARRTGLQTVVNEALRMGQTLVALPQQTQTVLEQIQRGNLTARIDSGDELRRDLRRLEFAVNGLTRALVFLALLLAATQLATAGYTTAGAVLFGVAGLALLTVVFRQRTPPT